MSVTYMMTDLSVKKINTIFNPVCPEGININRKIFCPFVTVPRRG